jgi:hypothetical protein
MSSVRYVVIIVLSRYHFRSLAGSPTHKESKECERRWNSTSTYFQLQALSKNKLFYIFL